MLTKEQEKLLDDIHSKVIEYLHSTTIKANKTDSEIKSDMDISIGESSDFRQIKILVDKYLEHAVKTNSPRFYNQLFFNHLVYKSLLLSLFSSILQDLYGGISTLLGATW